MNPHTTSSVLFREGLLPVTDLPTLIPGPGGKRLHRALGWRWIQKGLTAPDGTRVHLEAVKVGRRWMTSREAVERFINATSPGLDQGQVVHRKTPRGIRATTRTILERHGLTIPLAGVR